MNVFDTYNVMFLMEALNMARAFATGFIVLNSKLVANARSFLGVFVETLHHEYHE